MSLSAAGFRIEDGLYMRFRPGSPLDPWTAAVLGVESHASRTRSYYVYFLSWWRSVKTSVRRYKSTRVSCPSVCSVAQRDRLPVDYRSTEIKHEWCVGWFPLHKPLHANSTIRSNYTVIVARYLLFCLQLQSAYPKLELTRSE